MNLPKFPVDDSSLSLESDINILDSNLNPMPIVRNRSMTFCNSKDSSNMQINNISSFDENISKSTMNINSQIGNAPKFRISKSIFTKPKMFEGINKPKLKSIKEVSLTSQIENLKVKDVQEQKFFESKNDSRKIDKSQKSNSLGGLTSKITKKPSFNKLTIPFMRESYSPNLEQQKFDSDSKLGRLFNTLRKKNDSPSKKQKEKLGPVRSISIEQCPIDVYQQKYCNKDNNKPKNQILMHSPNRQRLNDIQIQKEISSRRKFKSEKINSDKLNKLSSKSDFLDGVFLKSADDEGFDKLNSVPSICISDSPFMASNQNMNFDKHEEYSEQSEFSDKKIVKSPKNVENHNKKNISKTIGNNNSTLLKSSTNNDGNKQIKCQKIVEDEKFMRMITNRLKNVDACKNYGTFIWEEEFV